MRDIDKLKEFKRMGDDGAKKVVENLSKLIGMEVSMNLSSVSFTSIRSVQGMVGAGKEMVGLYVRFNGPLSGAVLCLLSKQSVTELAGILLGEQDDSSEFSEMQKSMAMEVGNIITSSFIDIWANSLAIGITHSPPAFGYDMVEALIDHALIKAAQEDDFVMVFGSTIKVVGKKIDCNILIIPDSEKAQLLFDHVGGNLATKCGNS